MAKWKALAIIARYGHQSIPEWLGRPLTPLEQAVFIHALMDLREAEASIEGNEEEA